MLITPSFRRAILLLAVFASLVSTVGSAQVANGHAAEHPKLLDRTARRQLLLLAPDRLPLAALNLESRIQRAEDWEALGEFERAAEAHLAVIQASGDDTARAVKAWESALQFNLSLGYLDRASDLFRAHEQRLGMAAPEAAGRLLVAIIERTAQSEDWLRIVGLLTPRRCEWLDRVVPLEMRARIHASLGRALLATGKTAAARAEFTRVISLWKTTYTGVLEVKLPYAGNEEEQARRLARALDATGEALFTLAELERQRHPPPPPPRYRGAPTKEAFYQFMRSTVSDWVHARRQTISHLSDEYRKVVSLSPMSPPSWTIAAAARVGALWAGYLRDLRSIPAPPEIKRDPALRKAYAQALRDAFSSIEEQAKQAFLICIRYVAKYQVTVSQTAVCEAWLETHYPEEIDTAELYGTAHWRPRFDKPAPAR